MQNKSKQTWLPVVLIAGALAIWGGLLALGAFWAPIDEAASSDHRKLLVVAATTGLFLLLWGLVLRIHAAKVKRKTQHQDRKQVSQDT